VLPAALQGGVPFLVSLNRYERKKNIGLAIEAFALLLERGGGGSEGGEEEEWATKLVVAGG
jgi:glycosyltransferase involved in cell wall biosynthesis